MGLRSRAFAFHRDTPGTKVLQTGDLHLQGKMIQPQRAVLDWIVGLVEEQRIDVVCISGDLTGWHVPHRATDVERNEFARFVFAMCRARPCLDVVVLVGNHDVASNWRWLAEGVAEMENGVMDRIHLVDSPSSLLFGDLRIQVMPYPAKHWVEAGADGEGDLRAAVTAASEELGTHVRYGEKVFYTGHHGTVGATYGARPAPACEAENLTPSQILATGCQAAGLNHIHLPQQAFSIDGVVGHHVGAPYHLTFGDKGSRGVAIWTFGADGVEMEMVVSGSKQWLTVNASWSEDESKWVMDVGADDIAAADDIRVRLSWNDGDKPALKEIRKSFVSAKFETAVVSTETAVVASWDHSATLAEQFAAWCRDVTGREPKTRELELVSAAAEEVDNVR